MILEPDRGAIKKYMGLVLGGPLECIILAVTSKADSAMSG